MSIKHFSQIPQDGKGICGFTHMIQLLIDNKKLTLDKFNKKYENSTAFTEEWLKIQIDHDKLLSDNKIATALNQSLAFTGEFGDAYGDITIKQLLEIKTWDWGKRNGFALIPEAICDYVDRKYGLKMMIQNFSQKTIDQLWTSKTNNLGTGIYGIMKKEGAGTNKDQLQHYVYIDKSGELMTWTKTGQEAKQAILDSGFKQVIVRLYPA